MSEEKPKHTINQRSDAENLAWEKARHDANSLGKLGDKLAAELEGSTPAAPGAKGKAPRQR